MINLRGVTKSMFDPLAGQAELVLKDVSVSIPRDSRVALLGANSHALTTVLHLLAGNEMPDRGYIDAGSMRRSPVINAASSAGCTLSPTLTGLQNIDFFAGSNGIDPMHLTVLVEGACGFGRNLSLPVRQYTRPMRRALEIALVMAIPYDCYFIDRFHEFGGPILWQILHVIRGRGAGLVFTTMYPKRAVDHGRIGAVVSKGSLHVFPHVSMAIAHNEQS